MKHVLVLALLPALACSPSLLWAAPATPLTDPGELFTRLDRNGDGRIEAGEIDPAHTRLFRRLLTKADGNHDGALTREELAAGLKDNRPERPLEQLPDPPSQEEIAKAVFGRLDGDRNSRLELKEIPEGQKQRFQSLLKTADKDGNGWLDFKEFEGVAAQLMAEPPKASKKLNERLKNLQDKLDKKPDK